MGAHGSHRKTSPTDIAIAALFCAGVCLLLYPTAANWWSGMRAGRDIQGYEDACQALSPEEREVMLAAADAYNSQVALAGGIAGSGSDVAGYDGLLATDAAGTIGVITIPRIGQRLPIYHGTDAGVLQLGAGHLQGSSLPVGGPATHAVISAHRGLPSAALFTDLDKMQVGDDFQIEVLGRTLTYEVDKVSVVEPTELDDLRIEEGKDYCTLLTCTPYGINSQRLLVRGHRVENPEGDLAPVSEATAIDPVALGALVGAPLLVAVYALARRRRAAAPGGGAHARNDTEERDGR
jgi:sortase A